MRKIYTLTQEQYDNLLERMKPVPMIMLQCGTPPSQQENANDAWSRLGKEIGFDGMSVLPVAGQPLQFTAEELPNV